jgi:MFS family permease
MEQRTITTLVLKTIANLWQFFAKNRSKLPKTMIITLTPPGMLVGGYIWGGLSDSHSRKKTLIAALWINALCGFFSSFVASKEYFIFLRFLSGIGSV